MRISFNVLVAIMAAVAETGCTRIAPVEIPAPFLEDEVFAAARIARVQIVRSEIARQGISASNPICGYRYFASVVEPLKGSREPLEFFADSPDLLPGHEYLVFAHRSPDDARAIIKQIDNFETLPEQKMLACRMTASEYFLPIGRQVYFEFDSVAAKRIGGEWLAARERQNAQAFMWCNADWPSNIRVPRRNMLRQREAVSNGSTGQIVAWESAKLLIQEALKNPPYWWGGIPNPIFRPGAC